MSTIQTITSQGFIYRILLRQLTNRQAAHTCLSFVFYGAHSYTQTHLNAFQ